MELKHEQQCIEATVALEEFTAQWPDWCRWCGALGTYSISATRLDPPDGGLCSHCLDDGKCPRCASAEVHEKEHQGSDYFTCPECGWDELTVISLNVEGNEMVAPDWECYCAQLPTNHEFTALDEGVDECWCNYPKAAHVVQ